MRRLIALLAGGLGLRALLKRRSRTSLTGSPADDLRTRIAQAQATTPVEPAPAPVVEEQPVAEQPVEEQPVETQGVDERRADVHARARQAIDDLGADRES